MCVGYVMPTHITIVVLVKQCHLALFIVQGQRVWRATLDGAQYWLLDWPLHLRLDQPTITFPLLQHPFKSRILLEWETPLYPVSQLWGGALSTYYIIA